MKYRVENAKEEFGVWNVVHDEPAVRTIFDARCEDINVAQTIADALNAIEDFNNAENT